MVECNRWNKAARLHALAQKEIQIFWVAVEKQGQRIDDTPENYSLLVGELLKECLAYHPEVKVFVDAHFNTPLQRDQFDHLLSESCQLPEPPVHLDSQQDAVIQLADFVAGAILYQLTGKGDFASLITEKVVVGKIVKWLPLSKNKKR